VCSGRLGVGCSRGAVSGLREQIKRIIAESV
jgi:hypothetical protein